MGEAAVSSVTSELARISAPVGPSLAMKQPASCSATVHTSARRTHARRSRAAPVPAVLGSLTPLLTLASGNLVPVPVPRAKAAPQHVQATPISETRQHAARRSVPCQYPEL